MDENSPWFESLFLNNPIPRFIFNSQTLKIERVNPAATELYGYTEEEFLTKTLYDLRSIDGYQELSDVTSGLSHGDIYSGDVRHLTKDGREIWVQISAHPIEYNGSPSRVVQALDITEKKDHEDKINQIQRRCEALIEHSQDIITVTDIEDRVVYASPAFLKATGYTSEEVVNAPGTRFIHPDDFKLLPAIHKELLANPGKALPMVNRIRRKDGVFVRVEGTIANLFHEDAVQGIVANYHEITQRLEDQEKIKKSEAILRAVFDSAIEGFVITDLNLNIQTFNNVARDHIFSGTKRSELVSGANLLDYVSPDRIDFFRGIIPRVVSGESLEYKTMDQHDGKRWINYCLYPVQNASREIIGICIAGKDVTEKIVFEEQLKLSEQRYKALVKEGSDLINIIDFDGNYKLISSAAKSILDTAVIGENAFQFVHEDDREKLRQEFDLLRKVKRVKSSPYRFRVGKDKYIWMETVGTNLMDEPSVEGIVINSHEITDTINHIKAIEERNKRLEEIAWIHAHLVRAPLASILGIIEILRTSESEFKELMPYLEQSAVQLDKVIGEITTKANDLST
ncbi:PAS domain-containing protein [Daejeonella lutea]|uniref:histidine kinase n=1 Tax=Daejeonella lutea TaxID=572036 RepID=A0A1T5CYK2_9SPHI|nr:PAS domain S-box protein [Daejeonella lutea]SKB64479.1 PAS domain S-box-containing protein [Daejeonella lutea]